MNEKTQAKLNLFWGLIVCPLLSAVWLALALDHSVKSFLFWACMVVAVMELVWAYEFIQKYRKYRRKVKND